MDAVNTNDIMTLANAAIIAVFAVVKLIKEIRKKFTNRKD